MSGNISPEGWPGGIRVIIVWATSLTQEREVSLPRSIGSLHKGETVYPGHRPCKVIGLAALHLYIPEGIRY